VSVAQAQVVLPIWINVVPPSPETRILLIIGSQFHYLLLAEVTPYFHNDVMCEPGPLSKPSIFL
jgi:hypothetical protein